MCRVACEDEAGLGPPGPTLTQFRVGAHHGCCKACSQVNLFSGSFSIKCRMKSLAEAPREKQRYSMTMPVATKTVPIPSHLT